MDYEFSLITKTEIEKLELSINAGTGFEKGSEGTSFTGTFKLSKSLKGNGSEILNLVYKNKKILTNSFGNFLQTKETSYIIKDGV